MSPLAWLKKIFVPAQSEETDEEGLMPVSTESPFACNQHVRIVLAMVVVVIAAMAMWWILV